MSNRTFSQCWKLLWPVLLLAVLGFLIVYPMAMLVMGAFTSTDAATGAGTHFSLGQFAALLRSPEVGRSILNSFVSCGIGTVFAVILGVLLSWIVVRTNTPFRRAIGPVCRLPLFIPPLVAAVAWSILGSPDTGLLNIMFKQIDLNWHINMYSMGGLIAVFAMYYSPYVFMFTAPALLNMDPSFEEASEISGAGAIRTQLQVTFPLIAPAILSSTLLSFVIMLGIYGIPAVLGTPANLPLLATHIYDLTIWNPPQYNAAAALSIIMIIVTTVFVLLQQRLMKGRSYVTVGGKGFRPRQLNIGKWRYLTLLLGLVYLVIVVILPIVTLFIVAFRKFMFIPNMKSLFDPKQYSWAHFNSLFENSQTLDSVWNTIHVGLITAVLGIVLAFAVGYTVQRTRVKGRRLIDIIATSSASVPGLIIGVAYLWAWIGLPGGMYGTVLILGLALVGHHVADAVRALSNSMMQIHHELEEAAWLSGSGMLKTLRTVVLPLSRPGVIAALTLLFILSARELGTSLFLYTAHTIVMPVVLLDLYESGTLGTTAAFGLVQVAFIAVVIGVANLLPRLFKAVFGRRV